MLLRSNSCGCRVRRRYAVDRQVVRGLIVRSFDEHHCGTYTRIGFCAFQRCSLRFVENERMIGNRLCYDVMFRVCR